MLSTPRVFLTFVNPVVFRLNLNLKKIIDFEFCKENLCLD